MAEFFVKVVIIGDSNVGKTSLLTQLCDHQFIEGNLATIGIDYKTIKFNIDETHLKIQIWDTAGQERFRTITKAYYKGAQGVTLVYSVTDRKSFDNIRNWLKIINDNVQSHVPIILIGNKCDLTHETQVEFYEGEQLAKEFKIPFFECSAKENINVPQAFEALGKGMKDQLEREDKRVPQLKDRQKIKNSQCCN